MLADLKNALSMTGETFADVDMALALTAASRGIDNATGRRFYPDANASQVRFYSPQDSRVLWIDDLIELTALASDSGDGLFGTGWALNTDFVLGPLNATADGTPWHRISTLGSRRLPTAQRSVRVTGKFGWAAVPEGIKEATIILASKLLRRVREAPFGVVDLGIEGGAMRVVRDDPEVRFLIGPFTAASGVP